MAPRALLESVKRTLQGSGGALVHYFRRIPPVTAFLTVVLTLELLGLGTVLEELIVHVLPTFPFFFFNVLLPMRPLTWQLVSVALALTFGHAYENHLRAQGVSPRRYALYLASVCVLVSILVEILGFFLLSPGAYGRGSWQLHQAVAVGLYRVAGKSVVLEREGYKLLGHHVVLMVSGLAILASVCATSGEYALFTTSDPSTTFRMRAERTRILAMPWFLALLSATAAHVCHPAVLAGVEDKGTGPLLPHATSKKSQQSEPAPVNDEDDRRRAVATAALEKHMDNLKRGAANTVHNEGTSGEHQS